MAPLRGPAVPRRRLGAELRRLRESADLLIEQVAVRLECSTSKISRLETGKGIPRGRDVRDLLDIYGVDDPKVRDRLLRWAREGQQQGWWEEYADVLRPGQLRQDYLETLVALEADASAIRTFQPTVIPGLLQTRSYARALHLARSRDPASREVDVERWLDLRMLRQDVITRAVDPVRFHCVLDEAVFLRPVGGPGVMREQLLALLAVPANVSLRVLPLAYGPHPAMIGPFVVMEFGDPGDHDVVLIESHAGSAYLERSAVVQDHKDLYQLCEQVSLDRVASASFIAARAHDHLAG